MNPFPNTLDTSRSAKLLRTLAYHRGRNPVWRPKAAVGVGAVMAISVLRKYVVEDLDDLYDTT